MAETKYPLFLTLLAIVATWVALAAAALNVQWGAAPPARDGNTFPWAWGYVQVAAGLVFVLGWPAYALRPGQQAFFTGRNLLWQWGALGVGMVPAMTSAAVLSAVSLGTIAGGLVLLVGVSGLAMGLLWVAGRFPRSSPWVVTFLVVVTIVVPIGGFVLHEFFPRAGW